MHDLGRDVDENQIAKDLPSPWQQYLFVFSERRLQSLLEQLMPFHGRINTLSCVLTTFISLPSSSLLMYGGFLIVRVTYVSGSSRWTSSASIATNRVLFASLRVPTSSAVRKASGFRAVLLPVSRSTAFVALIVEQIS